MIIVLAKIKKKKKKERKRKRETLIAKEIVGYGMINSGYKDIAV
jgi:hypothetical protein